MSAGSHRAGRALPDGELALTLDLLTELVCRYRVDELTVVYCNRAWAAQYGAEPADLLGTPIDRLLNPDEMAGVRLQVRLLGPHAPFLRDPEIRPASRAPGRWVEWADRFLALPTGAEVLAVGRDVTERYLAEQRLAASEVLFRSLAESASDLVWRLRSRPSPELTYVSPSLEALTGWPTADLAGDVGRLRLILDEHGLETLDRALRGDTPPERFDMRLRRVDGTWVTLEMQTVALPDGWQGIGRDVTQVRALEVQLAELALRDPLTGLANRRLLDILLAAAVARTERTGAPLVVSLVDLDDFKRVNDEHGHAAGDAVLRQAAERLTTAVRGADVVARLGGDEFVVAQEVEADGIAAVHSRLVAALAAPYPLPDGSLVTCPPSIGTATTLDLPGAAPGELLERADEAMYRSKRAHRADLHRGEAI